MPTIRQASGSKEGFEPHHVTREVLPVPRHFTDPVKILILIARRYGTAGEHIFAQAVSRLPAARRNDGDLNAIAQAFIVGEVLPASGESVNPVLTATLGAPPNGTLGSMTTSTPTVGHEVATTTGSASPSTAVSGRSTPLALA